MGTGSNQGSFLSPPSTAAIASAINSPWLFMDTPASGPPTFQMGSPPAELRAGSATQSTIAIAKSSFRNGIARRASPSTKVEVDEGPAAPDDLDLA